MDRKDLKSANTEDNLLAAENAYIALEDELKRKIDQTESDHPGYDEYRYQVCGIAHDADRLMTYLTAKYGIFQCADIMPELRRLFDAQYSLQTEETTETVEETRTAKVGESLGQVVTSGYCNCEICNGKWAWGPTESGVMPQANHTIAVDMHHPTVPLGTHVVMNGVEYVVEDVGNFDRFGVDFDVYYDDHSVAWQHGHKTWEAFLSTSNPDEAIPVKKSVKKRILTVTLKNHGLDAATGSN